MYYPLFRNVWLPTLVILQFHIDRPKEIGYIEVKKGFNHLQASLLIDYRTQL